MWLREAVLGAGEGRGVWREREREGRQTGGVSTKEKMREIDEMEEWACGWWASPSRFAGGPGFPSSSFAIASLFLPPPALPFLPPSLISRGNIARPMPSSPPIPAPCHP